MKTLITEISIAFIKSQIRTKQVSINALQNTIRALENKQYLKPDRDNVLIILKSSLQTAALEKVDMELQLHELEKLREIR